MPLILARPAVLVCAPDPPWRELFARADVVSEGCARQEAGGRVWYGTSSLVLASGAASSALAAALVERDVHARLRALRTARREACVRAPAPLGPLCCEMRVSVDPRGVRIDVDVQAPLIEGRVRSIRAR